MAEEKEDGHKTVELRSEEVQEVMDKVSPWVVRSGTSVLCVILLIILAGCWLFRYPDTLVAEVTLATEEPPAFVLAQAAGKLDTLYVPNGSRVVVGEPLGVVANAARGEDVLWLMDWLEEWERTDYGWQGKVEELQGKRLRLGDVQGAFADFVTALSGYERYKELDYYAKKIAAQRALLDGQREYLAMVRREYGLIAKDTELAHRMYTRDSILYVRHALTALEYEEAGSKYLQGLQAKENAEMGLQQAEMQVVQYEEALLDIGKQAYDEEQTQQTGLKNALAQLRAQIEAWKHSYLLESPAEGTVTYMTVWGKNQNVTVGETVFMVQPQDSLRVLGKALLPLQGAGKVQPGQRVHIRLDNYPDQEFGYVKGNVESISPAPTEDGEYVLEISLPEGLLTNYGKQLPAAKELKGSADIILADRNVLERLLAPLWKVMNYEY